MSYAVLDVESTIFKKGHPYSHANKLCYVGIRIGATNHLFDIEYSTSPYGDRLADIRRLLNGVHTVVGFNLKFDLGWLARYGILLSDNHRLFDCQLAEYKLTNQQSRFPSLDDCLAKYGLPAKLDVVEREYWSLGIDTDQVPKEVLEPYLEKDLEVTDALHSELLLRLKTSTYGPLFNLHSQDERVLLEMEYNGIQLDWASMEQEATKIQKELDETNARIIEYVPDAAKSVFNTGSNDHISLLLYGGTLETRVGHPHQDVYKSGDRKGQSYTRHQWEDLRVEFKRLVDPDPKFKLKKEGFWSTSEDALKGLSKPKKLISALLKQAELQKLLSTYYHGIPKKYKEWDWYDGCIHPKYNQTTVITGRLSGSDPNPQNFPPALHQFIVSRKGAY